MLDFNIPQQYVAKAQQIVGAVSVEVTHDSFGDVLSSYLKAATRGANGNLRIQTVTFGENERMIKGKAIDDRLGCAVMIETL